MYIMRLDLVDRMVRFEKTARKIKLKFIHEFGQQLLRNDRKETAFHDPLFGRDWKDRDFGDIHRIFEMSEKQRRTVNLCDS